MLDVVIKAVLYNNITHNAVSAVFISKSLSANKALKKTQHTFSHQLSTVFVVQWDVFGSSGQDHKRKARILVIAGAKLDKDTATIPQA